MPSLKALSPVAQANGGQASAWGKHKTPYDIKRRIKLYGQTRIINKTSVAVSP